MFHKAKRTVRAVPGRTVVDPDTGVQLTDTPVGVNDSPFWRRRIRDGDVEEVKAAAVTKPTADPAPVAAEQPPPPPATSNKRAK